ncbi:O-acetylhomoserine aminocarboxypropyltransferase/cysteine synthase [Candidatus Sumerlaeota bacterium]|nr:O-acetylhomoserine aminocarboxypropyltransferase/cysteine synthase [Candidatus Sumerlaeota bacterium]
MKQENSIKSRRRITVDYKFETLALHAGQEPDAATLSRAVPVYRTSSYVFKSAKHAADLFALKEQGNIYSRIGNPTQDVLEQRMAALEGGAASLALASGTSAIFYTIINICSQGDEFVSANNLYGGTYTMFDCILPQFGIKTRFVDPGNPENFANAITAKTKAIYIETIGNPALDFADIQAVADIANAHHLPLIVDSTFTTPYLLRPIEHGAHIVVHSLTKWLGGHGTGIGGVVIDSGKFNWKDEKFLLYNEPDPSYHGIRYAHDLGDMNPIAFILRMRLVPLRNLGACISPDNAWLFLQGIETLPLRMERHCENAMKSAEFLKAHSRVDWVRYPGLKDDPSHSVASRYLKRGFGGMVVFGVKGGRSSGEKFINNLRLFSHLANVGDAKSLVIHPASATHSQLSEEDQKASGLAPELVRLSIGVEHIDDILSDLDQALEKI